MYRKINKHMQKVLPIVVAFLACIGINTIGFAQHIDTDLPPVQNCATMEQDSILRLKYPQLGELNDLEKVIQNKIKEIEWRRKSGRTQAEVITIPIIVHVIHNGEAVGQGANISAAQVASQIAVLNEDFRRKPGTRGFNDSPVGADIEIEFCLAALDPQGKTLTEKGIHRYNGKKASWTRDNIENDLKPTTSWDPNQYYNIWVLNLGGGDERILGYAQFPSQSNLPGLPPSGGPASTDGVVVSYRHFGSSDKGSFPVLEAPYNKGRTLTHETGHWLGLRHIWGDGPCGADDFVGDTPESDEPNRGCPSGHVSCGSVDMVQNYMDYTDDACMNIFTKGQKTRILAVMEVSPRRGVLVSSNVCGTTVTAAPNANFRADKQIVLRGATVNFVDLSTNFPTKWQWTFEGGEPSTSSERNPSVKYNVPGTYKVTLVASNSLGSSAPLIRENYITVSNEGLCNEITNFSGIPVLLRIPSTEDEPATGYLAGHNSLKHKGKSEFFENRLGYAYVSGTAIRFGYVYSKREDATVKVTVWNARGFQSGPGAVLEQKEVPVKQILQDIDAGRPTEVVFERTAPTFGRAFHIGVQLSYEEGDTIAIMTTPDDVAREVTSWEQDSTGKWETYAISYGLNVAHDITAFVGMNRSVQVSASKQFINQGESVTLNARGASLFSWGPDSGGLNTTLGPQVVVAPTETTTYTVIGGGLELCKDTASITIFVTNPTSTSPGAAESQAKVFPNPNQGEFALSLINDKTGPIEISVFNSLGHKLLALKDVKTSIEYNKELDLKNYPSGVYVIQLTIDNMVIRKRVVKVQ